MNECQHNYTNYRFRRMYYKDYLKAEKASFGMMVQGKGLSGAALSIMHAINRYYGGEIGAKNVESINALRREQQ